MYIKCGNVYLFLAYKYIIFSSSNNFKVVTVQADRPKVIKSGFTTNLRTIWFQFDQNVEGPDSCIDIFTSITLT